MARDLIRPQTQSSSQNGFNEILLYKRTFNTVFFILFQILQYFPILCKVSAIVFPFYHHHIILNYKQWIITLWLIIVMFSGCFWIEETVEMNETWTVWVFLCNFWFVMYIVQRWQMVALCLSLALHVRVQRKARRWWNEKPQTHTRSQNTQWKKDK